MVSALCISLDLEAEKEELVFALGGLQYLSKARLGQKREGNASRRSKDQPAVLGCFSPSTGQPCPQPDFGGDPGCACPWAAPAGVSKETWAAVCAVEPPHSQGRREARPPGKCAPAAAAVGGWARIEERANPSSLLPAGQFCSPQLGAQDAAWQGDQLSSQLYRNKQLQDTLLQKEEELARLHEENNNLRQYLNSALIKCLEEKAKKLLSCHGQKNGAILKTTKRRLKEDHCVVPQETPHASKARRNLFNEFTACEEQASPAIDSWVLQTLGLKDVNTIDENSANYSALSSDLGKDTYSLSPACGMPYLTGSLSPNKTEVAFTTSLSPHRNVRTHTFHQGQAFVHRGDDGGWRFTWVPKQAE
ncbi:geminin coiled-coil domain-containing protein 1 [Dryobates pubescens]|uniref:geminin coiled-coil domain-containing protein 1 n=1 Tax=Dryobates pubescens TaxID=118200 RepID=UPI0023BA1E19|nr:geminin coiled-coil domain-containing protein 1 [Dryobates pubescens]